MSAETDDVLDLDLLEEPAAAVPGTAPEVDWAAIDAGWELPEPPPPPRQPSGRRRGRKPPPPPSPP
jgi:hypothetical protein